MCSPNGTTIEAVDRLFANGFMDDVKEGFQAAVDRSIEMGKEEAMIFEEKKIASQRIYEGAILNVRRDEGHRCQRPRRTGR